VGWHRTGQVTFGHIIIEKTGSTYIRGLPDDVTETITGSIELGYEDFTSLPIENGGFIVQIFPIQVVI
jgi:hypothetical protein